MIYEEPTESRAGDGMQEIPVQGDGEMLRDVRSDGPKNAEQQDARGADEARPYVGGPRLRKPPSYDGGDDKSGRD